MGGACASLAAVTAGSGLINGASAPVEAAGPAHAGAAVTESGAGLGFWGCHPSRHESGNQVVAALSGSRRGRGRRNWRTSGLRGQRESWSTRNQIA